MAKIISIHSFRGGTGKSNTAANIAALLAVDGNRVAIVDTDIQSTGIHVLFGLDEDNMQHSLNDYLWGKCDIKQAAVDVTPLLKADKANVLELKGSVYLIPSSMRVGEIARILREGYDVGLLNDGYQQIIEDLNLDILMIDTHPGLNEETHPWHLDASPSLCVPTHGFQGTSVTAEIARNRCRSSVVVLNTSAMV
jgi:MinD-like ATPase involved in chromosome partitioning or flagellar assembly